MSESFTHTDTVDGTFDANGVPGGYNAKRWTGLVRKPGDDLEDAILQASTRTHFRTAGDVQRALSALLRNQPPHRGGVDNAVEEVAHYHLSPEGTIEGNKAPRIKAGLVAAAKYLTDHQTGADINILQQQMSGAMSRAEHERYERASDNKSLVL